MTVEEIVMETLSKYRSDQIMLDAFIQWASNPTSMTAGYGLEENYTFIACNLKDRYGLSESQASERVQRLSADCEHILQTTDNVYMMRTEILKQLEGELGEEWRKGIGQRLREAPIEVRKAAALLSALAKMGYTTSRWDMLQDPLLAYYMSAYGSIVSPVLIRNGLLRAGVLNRLLWISSKRTWDRQDYHVLPPLPPAASLGLPTVDLAPSPREVGAYIRELFERRNFEQLRVLDEVSRENFGARTYFGATPSFVSSKGICGQHANMIAISPFVLDEVRDALHEEKEMRLEDIKSKIENALVALRNELWPECELIFTQTEGEHALWRWDSSANPRLYLYLALWLAAPDLRTITYRIELTGKPSVMVILPCQSIPSAKEALEASFGPYRSTSVSLLVPTEKGVRYELVTGGEHAYAEKVVEAAGKALGAIVEVGLPQPTPVLPPEPRLAPHVPSPSPPQLRWAPPKDSLVVGEDRVGKQWGVIGRSGESSVLFDLNAPHVVFVCGKMGYGKGYTIGALTEMLVADPIAGLCDVTRKATIIVLYKPRENVPSEFYSITQPNDVADEVSRLRAEYHVEPQQLVTPEKFKVFVDPAVYQRAATRFQREYNTESVIPLYINPSSLTGDEWGIVLCAGERTEQQYVKRLFAILEKLQFETFDLDRVRMEVRSDTRLNTQQKNLAEARLDILGNYIGARQKQDFVGSLALGGVNIFDFRQTIRTPDDVFSVMTLIISVLQTKEGLENEPFVFVVNEAHDYFKGGVTADFVDSIERLIRRKRHGANWLLLDTHFPDDVDDAIIKLADVKVMHYMDKMVSSPLLHRGFGGAAQEFSRLGVGHTFILADKTSRGLSEVVEVEIRPRITKHGAPTKLATE